MSGLATRGLKKCSAGDADTRYDDSELIENEIELEPFLDSELKRPAGTGWSRPKKAHLGRLVH